MTGTDLFRRTMDFNYQDDERSALMREVWEPTPWMIDIYTGPSCEVRELEMHRWCFDNFGAESSPIHGMKGTWHRGGAVVCGWTWYGFASREAMEAFAARWPTPSDRPAPRLVNSEH